MIIAVASGKGGTGKTTVATALAQALARTDFSVSCLDCDVEAPNAHLFIHPQLNERQDVEMLIPQVDASVCTGCGKCAAVCQFHAIVVLGGQTLIFPELCHGCGSCALVCPENAITEVPRTLGVLEGGLSPEGINFGRGLLNVGEPMAVPVITQLKKWRNEAADVVIVDAPPGASCPVVESIRGADFVLLVTEPTPFGLHDLRQAYELTRELDVPAGLIINRDGIGNADVDAYCQEVGLPILLRIPLERVIGEGIAQGKSLLDIHPEYEADFQALHGQIANLAAVGGGR
ncbi:MAG: ATP-binding protein [Chloroflexota bacterium]